MVHTVYIPTLGTAVPARVGPGRGQVAQLKLRGALSSTQHSVWTTPRLRTPDHLILYFP